MHTTTLRQVGGSIMLAVPPALLDVLRLRSGTKVGITVEGGRLVIEPQDRPRYSLDEILAKCDPEALPGAEDREWLDGKPSGAEVL